MQSQFHSTLRNWRSRCGLSQSKAAEAIAVPLKTFLKWDQGLMRPSTWREESVLAAMAKVEAKIKKKSNTWCAMCGVHGTHGSGNCPEIKRKASK